MRTESGQSFILYTRCSTEEQSKKGNSHEYQTDGIRRSGVVTVGKLQEVGAYSDTVTGTKFDNRGGDGGLDAAHRLCEKQRGKVAYLFVYRWDRFGRSVEHCFGAIRRFREVGVEVNCPDEWIDYTDPSWPLILSVKFGMAQSESMRISDRTRDGVHAAKVAGFHTAHAPVGYVKGAEMAHNGKTRRVCIPCTTKAPIVRLCFSQYAEGAQQSDLFKRYGPELGIGKTQFSRMLSNPFYAGLVHIAAHRSEPAQLIPGQHMPIISRELFEAAQQAGRLTEHPAKGKTWNTTVQPDCESFYLKGVLKAPDTWRNMTAYRSRGKSGRRFPYYASQRRGLIIPAAKAHRIVGQALAGMRIDGEHYQAIKSEINRQLSDRTTASAKQADAARRQIERTRARLANIRTDYADGAITAAEYREMKSSFDAELLAAESKLIASEAAQAENEGLFYRVLDLLSGIDTVFAASTPEYKNRILRAVFPEGFTIDPKAEKVRTPCVNDILYELCSKSMNCDALEIENGTELASDPVKGGRPDRYRTHFNLLQSLFAA